MNDRLADLRARLEAERDCTLRGAALARHEETRIADTGVAAGLDIALRLLDALDGPQ